MPVHIGKFIQQKLKEDGRSVTWFASKICCTRSNVYKIFANDNIDIKLLKRISLVLDFNFFDVLAQECFDA
ncbi:MAG: XRE family transcriptional regulator [Bacteroidales bacterium]|nr:XRE family transcriptional regulator [Bacteroidales bacterium]